MNRYLFFFIIVLFIGCDKTEDNIFTQTPDERLKATTGKPYFLHLTDGFWLWIQRKTELTGCGCRLKRMNG